MPTRAPSSGKRFIIQRLRSVPPAHRILSRLTKTGARWHTRFMTKSVGCVLAALMLTPVLCCAGVIVSIDVELGSWDGATFAADGSDWNTYDGQNWAVGATSPGSGNPLLDSFNNVNLTDGEYWLYMADNGDPGATAVQIQLGYNGGPVTEVFTSSSADSSGPYTLVSGSGFTADLISGPQTTYTPVGSGQTYSDTGEADWVIDINSGLDPVPEPSSWMLLATGLAGLVFCRKYKRRSPLT